MYNKNQSCKKALPILIFLMLSLTACSASEPQQGNEPSQQSTETDINLSQVAHCDYWGEYAVIILNNYEAQIEAGTDNPLEQVKSWMTYGSSEEESPARFYFDAVLTAVKAQQPAQMVSEVGQQACAKFTEDQMDSANFYDAIE